jgi:cytochrome b561
MRVPAPLASSANKSNAHRVLPSGVHCVRAWSLVMQLALHLAAMMKPEIINCDQILARMVGNLLRPRADFSSVSNNVNH